MIITKSSCRPWLTGWRKHLQNGAESAHGILDMKNQKHKRAIDQGRIYGYSPCTGISRLPSHTEKYIIPFAGRRKKTGITLTESLAMYPASSVSGWYFPTESKYFGIRKISRDQ
jgi:cobalamin-dependent methionine synthase I